MQHHFHRSWLFKAALLISLLFSVFVKAETLDIRAISYDLNWVSGQGGQGYELGMEYQLWKYTPVEFTASLAKIDDLDYQKNNIQYNHNYAHATLGTKFNYSINDLFTISPEVGFTYSILDNRGSSITESDKGWYVGAELGFMYNQELEIILAGQFLQKNDTFDNDSIWSLGIRYTPYYRYKRATRYNLLKDKYQNNRSNRTSRVRATSTTRLAQADTQPSTKNQQAPDQAQASEQAIASVEQPVAKPKKQTQPAPLLANTVRLQLGAFKQPASIEHFLKQHGITKSEVFVVEEGGYHKVFLNPDLAVAYDLKNLDSSGKHFIDAI
jgi:hypothetical protein